MTHDSYKEQLSALLDGELDEAARAETLAHLEGCAECQAYFAELTALRGALNEADEPAPPADFAAGVLARLHAESAPQAAAPAPRKTKKRSPWRGWAALAACAAVVVLAVSTLPRMGMGKSAESAPMLAAAPADATAEAPAETVEETYGYSVFNAENAPAETESVFETSAVAAPAAAEPGAPAPEPAADTAAPTETKTTVTEAPAELRADGALTPLLLTGEGAEEWLEENAEPLEDGLWRVSVEAVNELPETLTLTGVEQPEDGMLIVALEEEAP